MIASFAKGYQVLRDEKYVKAAQKAASFIEKHLYKNEKLLKKQSEKKEASRGGIKKKKPQVVESKKIPPEKIVPKKTEQKSKEQPKLPIKEATPS